MPTNLKRMTFIVTPEIEASLKLFKKEVFYDRSQSDMIRELVSAGMRALETEKPVKEDK
ncbi:MAG TPA: hypothetical protein VN441_14105 [Syntrophomonas sp.]|nr:hypothetical protein [Syntrophomonas sp.]